MSVHPYHVKLNRVLERMGSLYLLSDILAAIAENKMQSFAEGDSWAITRVAQYPRARVLEIIAVVGDLSELRQLHDHVIAYAEANNVGIIQAYGRKGWLEDANNRGWKVKAKSFLYQREL